MQTFPRALFNRKSTPNLDLSNSHEWVNPVAVIAVNNFLDASENVKWEEVGSNSLWETLDAGILVEYLNWVRLDDVMH